MHDQRLERVMPGAAVRSTVEEVFHTPLGIFHGKGQRDGGVERGAQPDRQEDQR